MFLRFVYMEYHAKSGASSLKIERVMLNLVFGRFCTFLPFLCVFDIFAFLRFLCFVYMKYHAKSGASSLKTERVMLNLFLVVFARFCRFWAFLTLLRFYVFCVLCIWSTMQNLELLA